MTANEPENLASHYALQVALQTMKERCQNLQSRLTYCKIFSFIHNQLLLIYLFSTIFNFIKTYLFSVEDENTNLRTISGLDKPTNPIEESDTTINSKLSGQLNEVELLRDKVAELSRQKVQLTEHIAMVATENRQLWSRLSKLTKDNHQSTNKQKDSKEITANNLIRSKTFTQNSPNPMLRHKIPNDSDDHEMVTSEIEENTIGFGYLQDQEPEEDDTKVKQIQDTLSQFKQQIMNQQNELRVLYEKIQKQKGKQNIIYSVVFI